MPSKIDGHTIGQFATCPNKKREFNGHNGRAHNKNQQCQRNHWWNQAQEIER
jgi:hypothetical protein